MDDFWFLLATWFVPCGFLIALGYGRAWWRQRKRLRVPVTEKLLRGPGESLRKQLEKIEDQLSDELTMAFVLPLAFGGLIQALQHNPKPPFGHGSLWVMAAVGVIAYGVICRRVLRLVEEKRRRRLGLIGERAVGEELNHLMRQGAYVFHDVPNTPYGNVDHVVVATSGIYAVETKTRHKRGAAGSEAHRVIFDGRCLQFAGWNRLENRCLQQARQQADRLGDWLSKAVGEPVRAQAVLALPGWYVERRGRTEVWVMSGKEVSGLHRKAVALQRPTGKLYCKSVINDAHRGMPKRPTTGVRLEMWQREELEKIAKHNGDLEVSDLIRWAVVALINHAKRFQGRLLLPVNFDETPETIIQQLELPLESAEPSRSESTRTIFVDIPLFGSVPAGSPADNPQQADAFVSVPTGKYPKDAFALRVHGDSRRRRAKMGCPAHENTLGNLSNRC